MDAELGLPTLVAQAALSLNASTSARSVANKAEADANKANHSSKFVVAEADAKRMHKSQGMGTRSGWKGARLKLEESTLLVSDELQTGLWSAPTLFQLTKPKCTGINLCSQSGARGGAGSSNSNAAYFKNEVGNFRENVALVSSL
jgi:hypothetical protein